MSTGHNLIVHENSTCERSPRRSGHLTVIAREGAPSTSFGRPSVNRVVPGQSPRVDCDRWDQLHRS